MRDRLIFAGQLLFTLLVAAFLLPVGQTSVRTMSNLGSGREQSNCEGRERREL